MALGDKIMELFGAKPVTPVITAIVKPDPTKTGSVSLETTQTQDKAPLDDFAKMWQTPVDKDGKPISVSNPTLVPNLKIDPEKILAAAKQNDYLKGLPEELLTKIAAGDSAAMLAAINHVAQTTQAGATANTATIVERALQAQQAKFFDEVMPAMLRKYSIDQTLRADNPLFDNAAAQPVLNLISNQLQVKNPTASATEIKQLSLDYLKDFATLVAGTTGSQLVSKPTESTARGGKGQDTNWEDFFGVKASAA